MGLIKINETKIKSMVMEKFKRVEAFRKHYEKKNFGNDFLRKEKQFLEKGNPKTSEVNEWIT